MFSKILVANRGEIACRVFKTASRLGIPTVAVYSDADRQALHVKYADEAVQIGAAPATESYLDIEKIITACKQTGADAVHPGYGFLSERAEFAQRLAEHNITFIGPPPKAIEAMGDKITSKKIASEAKVSTVPGFMGLIDDADHAVKIAQEIGYPVMIKASAGGGGKGMRIAYDDVEAREGFERSKSEAASSFGDDRIFIEKFVEQPRHIEIQVLADGYGNCIYLGERECSIQRRNQKVIEEAPSPFLDDVTRKAMGEQSCALAKAVGYTSAGTVEFIVDKDRSFYFLEMNTRLQVEHPVTELITGVDLVEQMIKVAAGEKLDLDQSDILLNGWAVESRLYAEDPYRNFLPSIGRLTRYRPPAEGPVRSDLQKSSENSPIIRNDTGVFEGGEISMYYDPMIAKLCTWGESREIAVQTMAQALDSFEVEGIGHNLPFCSAVMKHPRFQSGNITTAFISEEYPEGFSGVVPNTNELQVLACFAASMKWVDDQRLDSLAPKSGLREPATDQQERLYVVEVVDQQYFASVKPACANCQGWFAIKLSCEDVQLDVIVYCGYQPEKTKFIASTKDLPGFENLDFVIQAQPTTLGYRIRNQGADLLISVMEERHAQLLALMPEKIPADTSNLLLCPMPGLLVKLNVSEGDTVEEGQPFAIVEATKMENVLRAEKSAVIASVPVKEGASLSVEDVILEFVR